MDYDKKWASFSGIAVTWRNVLLPPCCVLNEQQTLLRTEPSNQQGIRMPSLLFRHHVLASAAHIFFRHQIRRDKSGVLWEKKTKTGTYNYALTFIHSNQTKFQSKRKGWAPASYRALCLSGSLPVLPRDLMAFPLGTPHHMVLSYFCGTMSCHCVNMFFFIVKFVCCALPLFSLAWASKTAVMTLKIFFYFYFIYF